MDRRKANGYIRTAAEDRTAFDEQKRRIENTAFELDYEIRNIYSDTGSGGDLSRDGIRKLLSDAGEKRINAILTVSADMLATDNFSMSELLEAFTASNVRVYSINEKRYLNAPLDTLDNLSRKIYNTLSELRQNGIDLQKDMNSGDGSGRNDPAKQLQDKIIQAYLSIQPENGTRI